MTWFFGHLQEVADLALRHAYLAGAPLLLGLAVALPLGWLAHRNATLRPILVLGTGLLYTIPSLALFVLMPLVLGTRILDPVNVVVTMTIYTVALLVRTVADGLGAVADPVRQSAAAMGYGAVARLARVELPLAVPVISAGPMNLVTEAPTLPAPNTPSANPCRLRGYQAEFQAMPTLKELPANPTRKASTSSSS
jgi:osmoprotectant transport system permease protein